MSVPDGLNASEPGNGPEREKYPWPIRWLARIARALGLHQPHAPHWFIALFTFGLLVFAYRAWIESIKTTTTLQGQLDILRAEQRPFIYQFDIAQPQFNTERGYIAWNWYYVNFGRGIAYDLRFRSFIKIGSERFQPVPTQNGEYTEPMDLPPNKIVNSTAVSRVGLSQAYFDALMKQDLAFGILVEFDYWDASHKTKYASAFCMEKLATSAWTFRVPAQCEKQ